MSRIEQRFAELRARGEKGLVIYFGAGDPDLEATRQLAIALDRAGVDILELGVPFSDPLADALVNQLAAQRGLESGTTPKRVLEAVSAIRRESQIPLVLYIYFNLLHRVGLEQFIRDSAQAGVDGLLVLDLPPEESENYEALMAQFGLCPIYLIAPTTPEERIAVIAPRAKGFLYYVSREGVTGMQARISDTIGEMTAKIRRYSKLPVAVGFGISNPDQARQVAPHAEAIVVGSAVVDRIAKLGRSAELVPQVAAFVAALSQAIKPLSHEHTPKTVGPA
ncbi:MAG TPA: tryptophan synthase subunit alpha [Verrucomicrobiales bacterium]|nr:tryptophan synthase subunit alpha [Verrucomicrobiales bacterium]